MQEMVICTQNIAVLFEKKKRALVERIHCILITWSGQNRLESMQLENDISWCH